MQVSDSDHDKPTWKERIRGVSWSLKVKIVLTNLIAPSDTSIAEAEKWQVCSLWTSA